ncbi:hypothetical protein BGW39_009769 [Mortierella sp. 14UC]|nr:hypothetical protein BGW39_009769 [Mortierella sp. 14UC]
MSMQRREVRISQGLLMDISPESARAYKIFELGFRHHETKLETDRLQRIAGVVHRIVGPGADDEELMASLASLGLLQDVKDMMVEMDKRDYVCLPELQLLACGNHLARRPEKEMRSLFYVELS